jgi:hypothetical protein
MLTVLRDNYFMDRPVNVTGFNEVGKLESNVESIDGHVC